MSIDCTHCEPVLLDLCYGELTPQHEREVRTHILDCPTCRKALSRLEAGQALARHLPDEPPPPEMTERILRAAQIHVRRNSGSWLTRVQLLVESMARVAMTRQAAMVTLSLLIVFVGLWSYPELTRRREAHPTMVVESTHDGEAGPSREIVALPQAAPSAVTPEAPAPIESPLGTRAPAADERLAAAEGAAKGGDGRPNPSPERTSRAASARSPNKSQSVGGPAADLARAKRVEARNRGRFAPPPPQKASEAQAEAAQPSAAEADLDDDLLEGLAESRAAPAAPAAAAAETEAAPAPSAPLTIDDVFKAGVEQYRAENYSAAAQLFARMLESSAPSAQRAAALLYLARSERALGRCDRAIRAYETLVRSYGSAQQSSSALSEGVACYEQRNDAAGAMRLLDHASSVPSLSVQANRMAQERSAGKSAEPPAASPGGP